jgi:hypothetical protein
MVVCQTAIGDIIINNKSKTQIKRGTKLIDSAQQNSQFSEKVRFVKDMGISVLMSVSVEPLCRLCLLQPHMHLPWQLAAAFWK